MKNDQNFYLADNLFIMESYTDNDFKSFVYGPLGSHVRAVYPKTSNSNISMHQINLLPRPYVI
jgi:hypothetical protein